MPRLRRRGLPVLTVNRLVPSALTLLGLCAGLTAVRLALLERWELAVAAVAVAMVMDALDGRIARLMGTTSEFGAQLDSLADAISFGVAPALIVYLWALSETGGIGWAVALVFAVACTLRLARFNTGLGAKKAPPWADRFFTGVPAPAGAGLALLPMVLSFELGDGILGSGWFNGLMLAAVAGLMVSTIPTFSAKRIKIPRSYVGLALVGLGALTAFLVSTPWVTLGIVGLSYLASIPISVVTHRRLQERSLASGGAAPGPPPGPD